MTDKSATERLREMLDDRDVKWWPMHNNGYYEDRDTEFAANGKKHTAHEWGDGLAVYNLTPEQAIAATLGGDDKSRWAELFGTPERAARTLENGTPMCDWCDTQACSKRGGECSLFEYDALLEWLRGGA